MDRERRLYLTPPTMALAAEYGAMVAESVDCGEQHYPKLFAFLGLELDEPAKAIEHLLAMETWDDTQTAIVPSSTRWLCCDDHIVGEVRLRHRLNAALLHEGGHVGYTIRPSCRRQGYGTAILRLILPEAAARGIDPVLVTCDEDNVASARIIEHNGGVLEDRRVSRISRKPILRYWIRQATGE